MGNLKWDILGLGCAAVDDLVYVASYPAPDAKMPILRRERHCGGLTATALVAASRLSARCAFAGALGLDELSSFILERFRQENIDISPTVLREDAHPVHAIIVVDESHHTRNIFYNLDGVIGTDPLLPAPDVIQSAAVLFVDHIGIDGAIRAAAIARKADIPVVADLENDQSPRFAELLALVDHLVISWDFARTISGASKPAAAVETLVSESRKAIVITCGADGCWYSNGLPGDHPRHQPAFKIKVVDTTGCGDVFHGAYAAALAKGVPLEERIRFAAAAAAMKATQRGGQAGIPIRSAVDHFLKEQLA